MEKILIDTNAIVEYLQTKAGLLADILDAYTLAVSVVTVSELLASGAANKKSRHEEIVAFLNANFEIIDVDHKVAVKAAELVRTVGTNFAQSMIAATAIEHDIPLLTFEMDTFDAVPDIKLIDV